MPLVQGEEPYLLGVVVRDAFGKPQGARSIVSSYVDGSSDGADALSHSTMKEFVRPDTCSIPSEGRQSLSSSRALMPPPPVSFGKVEMNV